ncbi:CDP-diacylglycerol--glycerol-3-phosphate 3-phosphatidyltransferase [Mycoplasma anserisalpingitidis]|uniref:CDP-diacylglycerol--glycerol-3-phosphate 3-phosphatidyltransferase n=1 Tax=Mycoplasma anserisalpingitidis TaxID=519450 RepID=UPI0011B1B092|nr:CDP-diacylglycerol--glycerol-3-phosphate 3-phosphatidyltransferase [Mycoplasma anserisalpingitidis]QDY87632.1 CDP-diacylglycerol--glycerol-3-phosphate 3-phosphatidyltransferase [Mycoplasma anserisalpingitidis]UCU26657.1 CDP-diacylglycerol--glycerol-3-phosphate 3-phosphatidyltransferase [Mycoplasma anserisalpingitidis]UCU27495.1 CDP-diacylglycerol--glycerol-3-phosphate 3-phosphatidyltransferase [Mycoplasma anserisalpingitidis]
MKTNYLTKFKEMNLPNKLTITRLLLAIPLFVFSLLAYLMQILSEKNSVSTFISTNSYRIALTVFLFFILIIFIGAMITDYYDGKIAREKNLVSDFGKLWDPIADKMITTISILLLLALKAIPLFVVIIFLVRDVIVAGCRTVLAQNNVSVAANMNGKIKTVLMSVGIVIMLIFLIAFNIVGSDFSLIYKNYSIIESYSTFVYCLSIPLMVAAIFNIISGYQYVSAAIKFMK